MRRDASRSARPVSAAPILAGSLAALLAGCSGAVKRPEVATRIATVDAARLRKHVEELARLGPRTPGRVQASRAAVDYIVAELERMGYRPRREGVGAAHPDEGGSMHEFENVVAELPGAPGAPVIELGAHYDTVTGSPGADDNASGVAGVLEAARALAGSRPEKTVRFLFFALEEHGKHGSRSHVERIRERGEELEGTIVFEMIGYASREPGSQRTPVRIPLLLSPPRTGDFIAVIGNIPSGRIGNRFESAARRYVPELDYFSANRLGGLFRDSRRSDHEAYWDAGYRAIMLTDTANFRNPSYHQPSDTPETLDYDFLRRVTMATAATLLEWAGVRPDGGA